MRRMLILGLAAVALAGCGSSGQSAQAQRDARCRSENLAWARGYADSLPAPASQAQVENLAAPLIQACERGVLKP